MNFRFTIYDLLLTPDVIKHACPRNPNRVSNPVRVFNVNFENSVKKENLSKGNFVVHPM
jgi:hypothetical protein